MTTLFKRKSFVSVTLSVLLSMLFVYAGVSASTTISTDITTDGDVTIGSGTRVGTGSTATHLTVLADGTLFAQGAVEIDGSAWTDGAFYASSTLNVTGASSFVGNVGIATNTPGTVLGVQGRIVSLDLFTGDIVATGTASVRGALYASSTLNVTGASAFVGNVGIATNTPGTVLGVQGSVVSLNLFTGNIIATGTLEVRGVLASTTAGSDFSVQGNLFASTSAFVGTDLLTNTLLIGTTTSNTEKVEVVGNAIFMGTATTSVKIDSSGTGKGGCLQLRGPDGIWYMLFIKPTSTVSVRNAVLEVKQGTCTSDYSN